MSQQSIADSVRQAHQQQQRERAAQRAAGRESLENPIGWVAFPLWLVADVATAMLAVNAWLGGRGATPLLFYVLLLAAIAALLSAGRIILSHWSDVVPAPVLFVAVALFALNIYANADGSYIVAEIFQRPLEDSWFMFTIVALVELGITTFLEYLWFDPLIRRRGARAANSRRHNGGVR